MSHGRPRGGEPHGLRGGSDHCGGPLNIVTTFFHCAAQSIPLVLFPELQYAHVVDICGIVPG